METASILLVAAQTLLLAASTFFTWRTIRDANEERERERTENRRRDEESRLTQIADRALEVYEAAEAWRTKGPEGRLFEPAQKRLAHALAVGPGLPDVEALAQLVGEPASSIDGDLVSAALDEVEAAHRDLTMRDS